MTCAWGQPDFARILSRQSKEQQRSSPHQNKCLNAEHAYRRSGRTTLISGLRKAQATFSAPLSEPP